MKKSAFVAASLMAMSVSVSVSVSVSAQETQITVLGVTTPAADYNRAVDLLFELGNYYYWASGPNPTGVTIKLANGGIPVPIPTPNLASGNGNYALQYAFAVADVTVHGLRHDADVVIVFVGGPDGGICGLAPQLHWTSAGSQDFVPDPLTGLDLRGSEDSYIALAGTTGGCNYINIAVHELGHLLGAGHETAVSGNVYLFPDSHAKQFFIVGQPVRTVMWSVGLTTARLWSSYPFLPFYSDPNTNNIRTVRTTAVSVANYRVTTQPVPPVPVPPPPTPAPPGCGLSTPVGMSSTLLDVCDPFPYTHYLTYWGDVCPGAPTHYELFESVPLGQPYVFGHATPAPQTWQEVWILGPAPGGLKVRACDGASCTALSNETVIVPNC